MSVSNSTPADTITQLNAARALVLKDATRYRQIITGVMPLISPAAPIELRRWGADFLAETFASPMIPDSTKEDLALESLQTLKGYMDNAGEDANVIKSAVQAATSVYPLMFKHAIYRPEDAASWHTTTAMKSNIFRRMDSAMDGIKICCIKFVARVVQMQTPGLIADPRRPDQNELSLALVPREHPLISAANLEAEAFGLLDRLLQFFQDQPSDAILVSSTLNCIGVLARTRASLANRILNTVLNFNPFRLLTGEQSFTPRMKVAARSMERTTRAFLTNLIKRAPNHPMNGRIQGYLERLHQTKLEAFDETSRKRPAPTDPTEDGQQSLKKPRLGGNDGATGNGSQYPPLPSGPISLAQLFTLSTDPVFATFPATNVPEDTLTRILVPLLQNIDQGQFDNAVNAVRSRCLSLLQAPPIDPEEAARAANATTRPEVEPNSGEIAQVYNNLESVPEGLVQSDEVSLGAFVIPQPPPLNTHEVVDYGKAAVERVLDVSNSLDENAPAKHTKLGFNRLAAGNYNRDSWMTVVTRLATRSLSGLQDETVHHAVKQEEAEHKTDQGTFSVSESIRDSLYLYILDDFRKRMDVAISWLNEEWYNDQVQMKTGSHPIQQYHRCALRVLDGIVPYLDARDKVLIRFLSEIPSLSEDILERVKKLADDPERVALAVNSIHYLVLYRPPAREMALDAIEDLWRNYDDARNAAAKVLTRWRPTLVQVSSTPPVKSEPKSPTPVKAVVA